MEHEKPSVLGRPTVTLVIVATIAVAPILPFAHSLQLGFLGVAGLYCFSIHQVGAFFSPSLRTTAKTEPDSLHAGIEFQFAPVRVTHKGVLEAKGYSPWQSTFQIAEAVAQVAG